MKVKHNVIVAGLLGNDGTNWSAPDGITFEDLVESLGGERTVLKEHELWQYTFKDDSKIYVTQAYWTLSLDV